MKKTAILIAVFSILAVSSYAQDKPAATPPAKPQYQMDAGKPFTVTMTFTVPALLIDNYIFVEQNGGVANLPYSQQLSALEATNRAKLYAQVLDSVKSRVFKLYSAFTAADKAKFTADTLRAKNAAMVPQKANKKQ